MGLKEILRPRYNSPPLGQHYYLLNYYLCVIKIIDAKYDFQTRATTTTTFEMSRLLNSLN